jgi:hypothetical protein
MHQDSFLFLPVSNELNPAFAIEFLERTEVLAKQRGSNRPKFHSTNQEAARDVLNRGSVQVTT